jgi:sugar fermentation stimulation protein A
VTLVEGGVARFPDAPTLRGTRHVHELIKATHAGDRAAVLFVVQRDDATHFAPHYAADAKFGEALRQAAETGVEVLAWRCRISLQSIQLEKQIPVVL